SAQGEALTLEMRVDVFERESLSEHENLEVVQQLADLLSAGGVGLVFGGHPRLGGFLHDLLANCVHSSVEPRDSVAPLGAGDRLLAQLSKQRFERLHASTLPCAAQAPCT